MKHYIFDLSKISQAQVKYFLYNKARIGLTGGIYIWMNQTNGHFYVGSTLNFYQRIAAYFTLNGTGGIIKNALIKYGFEYFTLVLFIVSGVSREEVLRLEQFILDTWKPEYNLQPYANSSAGRVMTEESKAKLAAFRKGLKLSEETKAKISASLMGKSNGRFNKGIPVFLYEVYPTGYELSATFPNRARASTILLNTTADSRLSIRIVSNTSFKFLAICIFNESLFTLIRRSTLVNSSSSLFSSYFPLQPNRASMVLGILPQLF
jgi:hypothetical protein